MYTDHVVGRIVRFVYVNVIMIVANDPSALNSNAADPMNPVTGFATCPLGAKYMYAPLPSKIASMHRTQ